MKKQPALWKMKCRLLFGLDLYERENYANWPNTPLSQMALMSFCKMVMGGLAVSYFLFMWMIGPFMSSVKQKGGYANKIFGSRLPGVYWPYIEG